MNVSSLSYRTGSGRQHCARRIRAAAAWAVRAAACGLLCAVVLVTAGCAREITPEDRARAAELVALGFHVANVGSIDSARVIIEMALELDSTSAEGHYRLGVILEYMNLPAEATASYRRAARHDSTLAVAHLNLGQLLGRSERYDEALVHFNAALRHSTSDQVNALTCYCLGMTYGILGDAVRGAEAYDRAVRIDTAFARAYVGRGQELLRQGKPEEALPSLERALALDSTLTDAYGHLATAYRLLGRLDEAEAADARRQATRRAHLDRRAGRRPSAP